MCVKANRHISVTKGEEGSEHNSNLHDVIHEPAIIETRIQKFIDPINIRNSICSILQKQIGRYSIRLVFVQSTPAHITTKLYPPFPILKTMIVYSLYFLLTLNYPPTFRYDVKLGLMNKGFILKKYLQSQFFKGCNLKLFNGYELSLGD